MMDDVPGAIVLGCGHGGLAALRSLARRDRRVLVLTDRRDDIALASRVFAKQIVLPAGLDDDQLTGYLLNLDSSWDGSLVLETEDRYSEVLSRRWGELSERFVLACQPHNVVKWFLDKSLTHDLAQSVGVPVPAQRVLLCLDDVDIVEADWFPAIVKPCSSSDFSSTFGDKLWVVANRNELRTAFLRASAHGIRVVLHERIPGSDCGTLESIELYINRDGTWGAEHFNVKLRQSPPGFGVMRAGRTVDPIDDVRMGARSLLNAVGYRGFASAEFKRDPRDGVAKLIEINVRLPRNLQLMVTSGVDFPWIMYEDLVLGHPSTPVVATHATFVDSVADLSTTLLRDRETLRNPTAWLSPYLSGNVADAVWSRHDVGPYRRLIGNRSRKVIRRARRALDRRETA